MGALDIFAIGHLVGWIVKALMLRDSLVCWIISIQWELIEQLFKYQLPNFAECWWDSWILDVVLTNGVGIYLGNLFCQYLEMRQYNWTTLQQQSTLFGKLKRSLLQFTPSSWMAVKWEHTRTINKFLVTNIVIVCLHLAELNAFFLKYLLWIPPEHTLNFVRLFMWVMLGPTSIRQVYIFMTVKSATSIGTHTFLGLCILATELLLIVKMSKNEFPAPMPKQVKIGWCIMLFVYAIVVAFVCLRIVRRKVPTDVNLDKLTEKSD